MVVKDHLAVVVVILRLGAILHAKLHQVDQVTSVATALTEVLIHLAEVVHSVVVPSAEVPVEDPSAEVVTLAEVAAVTLAVTDKQLYGYKSR